MVFFRAENKHCEFIQIAFLNTYFATLQISLILIRHSDGIDVVLNQQADPLALDLQNYRQIRLAQINFRARQLCIQDPERLMGLIRFLQDQLTKAWVSDDGFQKQQVHVPFSYR